MCIKNAVNFIAQSEGIHFQGLNFVFFVLHNAIRHFVLVLVDEMLF